MRIAKITTLTHDDAGRLLERPLWTIRGSVRTPDIIAVKGGVEVYAPSRARRQSEASIFIPYDKFDRIVLAWWSFNARTAARAEGPGVAWEYADGHGMMLVTVIRIGKPFEVWLPGHHSHGPGVRKRYIVVESSDDLELREEYLPNVSPLKL